MRRAIVEIILSLWRRSAASLPEARWKHWIRARIFQIKPYLEREFTVNRGETVVLVGSPRPAIIERTLRIVGPKGKVVLVEADPTNVAKHEEYFSHKSHPNLHLIPKAASNQPGKSLFLVAPDPLDHRLVVEGIEMDNDYIAEDYYLDQIEVPVTTLDEIGAELGLQQVHYLEVTVNGAEFLVLQGAQQLLPRVQRAFIKAHAINQATGQPLKEEIRPFLEGQGFQTLVTIPMPSSAQTKAWRAREGDVYAWRG